MSRSTESSNGLAAKASRLDTVHSPTADQSSRTLTTDFTALRSDRQRRRWVQIVWARDPHDDPPELDVEPPKEAIS